MFALFDKHEQKRCEHFVNFENCAFFEHFEHFEGTKHFGKKKILWEQKKCKNKKKIKENLLKTKIWKNNILNKMRGQTTVAQIVQ